MILYFASHMGKIITTLLFSLCLLSLNAQSINTEFGKNRVQFHDDFNNWWQYETENFITYWYGKARLIAQPVIQIAEMDHDAIRKIMEHKMNDKIEIIVYTDISDLKQSNIGTEETFSNKTGETKIVGNKMFVYFDGNHKHLQKKIKEGIATVYFNNMLFGTNLQEIIQNAVLMNIPDWYKQGVIAYSASSWNHLIEDELRDIWEREPKYHDFNKIAEQFPRVAGHSFWFYIDQNYGKSSIANLLYLAKISRGTDNSFEYILNADLETLKEEWAKFYELYFNAEKGKFLPFNKTSELKLSNKKHSPVSCLRLSPAGDMLVYVYNDQGKFKIVLNDLKTGKEKRIFKYGYKNVFQETDYNYPLLAWHPKKQELSYIYEHNDVIKLVKYNLKTNKKEEQIIPTDFQRIYSFSYIDDLNYVFSATTDGFSDLYLYKSKNRNYQRITNDFYDDLDAEYVKLNGKNGILFSSNRVNDTITELKLDTILPLDNFDIFFLEDNSSNAKRLTKTPQINERLPFKYSDKYIIYTGDGSGNLNINVLDYKSNSSYAVTDLDRNLINFHSQEGNNKIVSTIYKNGKHIVYYHVIDPSAVIEPYITQSAVTNLVHEDIQIPIKETPVSNISKEYDDKFLFQSAFKDPEILEPINIRQQSGEEIAFHLNIDATNFTNKPIERYNNTRAIAANNKFGLNNITTKLDNDLLFGGLESYTGDRQQLITTPMGFLFKANIKDLFEDYVVEGGVRIPTTFNGSEYFLVFDNKKSRIDKRFALYRKSNEYNNAPDPNQVFLTKSKKTILLGMYQLKYPFDIYRSIRATTTLRFDRFLKLSTESNSFNAPAVNEKRVSLKLEYIFDNSHDAALNIKNGTRYKFFIEAINQFDLQVIDGFKFDLSKGFTGIIGFDARHYIPILRKSVLALRASGATSLGSQKMLYYLGGTENWFFPKFDNSIPVREDGSFAYKVNAFQLRGFNNNIRNGATFLLSNIELRIPFMQYILGTNRGTSFFKNMQLVGFYDAGLAWHGAGPFSPENPLNKVKISSPPLIELNVEYFRDPLVMGYGLGFRTQLLGYFIKADYAWGIETRKIQPAKFYLSFGLDF